MVEPNPACARCRRKPADVVAVAAECRRNRCLDDGDHALSDLVEAEGRFDASVRQQRQAPGAAVRDREPRPIPWWSSAKPTPIAVAAVSRQSTRLSPKIACRCGIEHFNEAVGRRDLLAEVAGRAGLAQIEPAKLDRVEAGSVGKTRHLAFHRVGHLVGAEAAKGAANAVVGIGESAAAADVGDLIWAAGVFEARFKHARAERRICAAVDQEIELLSDQAPGGIAAGSHADAHRIAHSSGETNSARSDAGGPGGRS